MGNPFQDETLVAICHKAWEKNVYLRCPSKCQNVYHDSASQWVPADVVCAARFPSNRRLFNKIVRYCQLFCTVT